MSSSVATLVPAIANKYYGCSKAERIHVEYEWIIQDFSLFLQESGECIYSPIFSAKEDDNIKWKLELFPQGITKEERDYVSLYLYLDSHDSMAPNIKGRAELSIFKSESIKCTRLFTWKHENPFGSGFSKMMERSKLLSSSGSDDSFTIRCKIDIPQRVVTKPVNPVSFDLQQGKIGEHFSQLFEDSRFSDVTIIVGNEKFTAHKVVLAARSTVFAAMFEHKEMEENRKNEVKIEDLEPATVRGMLEFFYKDEVTDLETLARGLLRASDKYDLSRLRVMCEEALYKTLTTDNAAEILELSDIYHAHKLKEYVMAFIDGHLPDVARSESFKRMGETHPSVLVELVQSMAIRREPKASNSSSE